MIEKFKNVKVDIYLMPVSHYTNQMEFKYFINKEYELEDHKQYFIPHYITFGTPFGGKIITTEKETVRYHERPVMIKMEYKNKFIRGFDQKYHYYGYFDSLPILNRYFNNKMKPYILNEIFKLENIKDDKLIKEIKNFRFR